MNVALLRRLAVILFSVSILALIASAYVSTVYAGNLDTGAEFIVNLSFGEWVATFFATIALMLVLMLFLYAAAPRMVDEVAPMAGAAPSGTEIVLTCAQCRQSYTVPDGGERPLYHACPHCGHSDVVGEAPLDGPIELPEPAPLVPGTIRTTAEGHREMVLRCTACHDVFTNEYSERRPLYAVCPNCGKRGVLTEPAPLGE